MTKRGDGYLFDVILLGDIDLLWIIFLYYCFSLLLYETVSNTTLIPEDAEAYDELI